VTQVLIDQLHVAEAQALCMLDERILPTLGLQVLADLLDCLT